MKKLIISLGVVIITLLCNSVFSQNPSDGCTGVPSLTVNGSCTTTAYSLPGSYSNGGLIMSGTCVAGNDRDDGWYQFTATATSTTIDLTGDRARAVVIWTSCAGGTELGCDEQAAGTTASVTVTTIIGITYSIQVHRRGGNNTAAMAGTICVYDTPASYCTPAPTSVDGTGITNITCGAINNSTGAEAGNYGDYSAQVATFMQNTLCSVDITYETGYTYVTKIWVDWNDDADFLDAGEEVYSGTSTNANPTTLNASFTVPIAAIVGNHRMRIGGADSGPPTPCYTGSYASYEDYTLNVTATAACSGTPTAGTATASPTPICAGASSTLTLTGYTAASGITFQWQSAPAVGGPWTNIGGATSDTYVASPASSTFYRCVVTCTNSSLSANSSSDEVVITMLASCYCNSSATSTSDMDITNISFGTINNTTPTVSLVGSQGTATGTAGMKSDFWGSGVPIPSAMQGATIPFDITIGGTAYGHAVYVFIDFNQDGDLVDAGENFTIFPYANPSLPNTTNSNISIPITATTGNTLMRIVCVESSTFSAPCGTYTWGETEDYNINITAAAACSGTPTAGTATASPTAICSGESSTISLSGYTVASGITFQWQSSPNPVTVWTNIAGATSISYIASPTETTNYRCVVTCTNSGLSDNSNVELVTVDCVVFGTGTSTTSHPYRGGYDDAKSQYIISASELIAAGFCGGSSLTSLAFNVSSKSSSQQYKGFTLRMGHTTATNFPTATWLTPTWVNVYSSNWTTALGWNIHTFSTSFVWNGIDNVVVQTCYNNTSFTSTDYVYYTTTASNTACYNYADGANGCNMSASYTSTGRPNMKFNYTLGADCSGTPTGGTTSASPASICVGDSSVLSLTGQTIACGITYQWQSSPNPVTTWTNIAGATSTSFSTFPVVSTNYRCVVTCSNSSLFANSAISLVTIPIVPPDCSTYNSPADGSTNITCGLILEWTAPAVTSCNPADSYDVYFGTNATPPFVVNQAALLYNPGALLPSTTYYWRIVPRNTSGPATGCNTVWSFTTGVTYLQSQTTPPIIDGFEDCLDWTIVNGAQANVWLRGSATSFTGSNSMYIHNGGGTDNDYTTGTSAIVHFYKDIVFPAGNNDYNLKFYWKGEGESTYDYLRVFLAPTSITPVAGTQVSSTYELTPYIYNQSAIWQFFSETLPIACGGNETKRLIFSWRNDGSGGTQPPIAVDDIQVLMAPRTGTTCANPVNVTLPYTQTGETTACMNDDYTNASVASCGSSYESGEDKVYKVLVGAAGCVNVSLTNASNSSIGFQVYDNCPDAAGTNCIFNSTTGATGGNLSEDINMPAPGYYYLIVDNWAAPANVDYDIAISSPGGNTVNDPCSGAIPLTLGISASGDNTCTNAIGEPAKPACWTTGIMNTVWYRVTIPASNDLYITTNAGSLLKTQIDFYRGNSCGGLTYIDCNQDASSCGTSYDHSSYYLENIGPGNYLYIRVDGENDLVGSFSIMAIDGLNQATPALPPLVGQDCGPVLTSTNAICGQTTSVGNPGLYAYGNICDFTGSGICLSSGERSSVWYTINISSNGTLEFDIVPNDFGNPNPLTGQTNSGYTSPGDETDYDWALWRWETTCDGTGDGTFCCTEIAAGSTSATRCNYSSLGVTGTYGAGTNPPAYTGFASAYESSVAVSNGEIYVLAISNYTNDFVSGFSLQFSGSSPVAYATPGATMTWASSTSNSWMPAGNWGGCGPPDCGINGVIASGGAQPIVSSNVTVKDLTINAGATLTLDAGVTLTVCGDFTNNGTLIADPTSTILFDNASVTHTISGNLTGTNKIGGLKIDKTGGSVILTCDLDIGGDFSTQNTTSILNVANYYLKVGGNFSTAANSTLTNCPTIEFNGTIPQTYTNSSGNLTYTNVVMNNTGGGIILTGTATSNLYVAGLLTLTNGIIYTADPPLLVMNAGSSSSSGSAASFVDGPMQKIGNTAFVFPTGDAFNRWMRIGISAPTVSTTFQAQYFYTPYTSLTPMAATPTPVINSVSALEYWQLDRVGAGSNAAVTLYWENATSSGITSCAALQGGDLVVARWNSAAWENRSNTIVGGITGSCVGSAAGTVTSDVLSNFSPFTFGSKANPLPVELLSFTGKNNGDENILEWVTSSEINNDYFTLERGTDGYNFEQIDFVNAEGNSNTIKNYHSIDTDPLDGINYYRLKQTDFDGSVRYASNLVALNYKKDIEYTLFPNPAKNEILIYASLLDQESTKITITDVYGRKVMEQKQFVIGGGKFVSLDISQFAEGIYFVIISDKDDTFLSQKKFLKMD